MNRRSLLLAALSLPSVARADTTVRQSLPLGGIQGAALLGDGSLLLSTAASPGLLRLPRALERLRGGPPALSEFQPPPGTGDLASSDLEDLCLAAGGYVFAVGSHSRTPLGDSPADRYTLCRLRFTAEGRAEVQRSDALLRAIQERLPFLADSIRRPPARAGLNIEGLSWTSEDHLLLGLRSPTITESTPRPAGGQEDAVVLRIRNPQDLFTPGAEADLADPVKLDLRGQGIRGMASDGKDGCWILSGTSVDPGYPLTGPWALWHWDGRRTPRSIALPETGLRAPTACCRFGEEILLLDEGTNTAPMAWVRPT